MSVSLSAIILSVIGGFVIGVVYFASLWFSVRSLTRARTRWRTFAATGILRAGAMLSAFALVLILGVDTTFILTGALGFIAARLAATRLARPRYTAEPGKD